MPTWKRKFRHLINRLGYDLTRLPASRLSLSELEFDLPVLVSCDKPVVLDVGANKGQTIELMLSALRAPLIFSFEPNPTLAAHLSRTYGSLGIEVTQAALGSEEGTTILNVADSDDLSSILEFSRAKENPFYEAHTVVDRVTVPMLTLDTWAKKRNVQGIDLLKIDTQGFDLEVLKGATEMLSERRPRTILIEVSFISIYEGQCSFCDINDFLRSRGYALLTFYEIARPHLNIGWATACYLRDPIGTVWSPRHAGR
jgi:FkbM family methyltransferase